MRAPPIPANKNQKPKTTPKTALANLASPKIECASHVAPSALESAKQFGFQGAAIREIQIAWPDRKSTRLNSSHLGISYAVFCLKKKTTHLYHYRRNAHQPRHGGGNGRLHVAGAGAGRGNGRPHRSVLLRCSAVRDCYGRPAG